MGFRDVVDELLNEHRLADAGAPEEPDLAALSVGRKEVDDLDASLEDLHLRGLLDKERRGPVNGRAQLGADGRAVVDRVADHVEDAPEALGTDGHLNGGPGVPYGHPAHQAVGGVHGDGADRALAEVLRDLEREVLLRCRDAGVRQLQGVVDLR